MAIVSWDDFEKDGLILFFDIANRRLSSAGAPTTNQFAVPTPDANNNVTFAVQGTGTFQRIYSGEYGGETIGPTDVVYRYNLGGSGCHYHGNSAAIGSGKYVVYSVDYYISPDASNYPTNNSLVVLENYGGGALGGGTGTDLTPTALGRWTNITGYAGPTTSSGTQAMFLYPGGCGSTYMASRGFLLMRNPRFEFLDTPNSKSASTSMMGSYQRILTNSNLEGSPTSPSFNTNAGASFSSGTATFASGSYSSKGGWDLYKTYTGMTNGLTYTWSALVKLGTATNLIAVMNNTSAWNTGPSAVFTTNELSTTTWRRITLTGTTNTGQINLHLGASANTETNDIVQSAGTVFFKNVSLIASDSIACVRDITGHNTFSTSNLTYPNGELPVFNKSTSCIDILNPSLIAGTSPFTIEAEIIVNSGTSGQAILGNYGTGYTTNSVWFATHGLWINGACPYFPGGQLPAGMYIIAATRDASGNTALYKNGKLEATGTNTSSIRTDINWRIGKDVNGDGEPFDGSIYSLKVYNKALTAAQIQQNFAAYRGRLNLS